MSDEIHTDDQLADSPVLEGVFGDALDALKVFHGKLAQEGEPRGLIGPRDVDILWERHLLNSAAIVPFVREATEGRQFKTVADIGSGGGFPGLVAAAMLPDHAFTLIEPMERRCEWLDECVEAMGLRNVTVVRARAEEAIAALDERRPATKRHVRASVVVPDEVRETIRHPFAAVTCRAVAPLTKLAGWTLPLVEPGGELIALKGRSAPAEIDKARKVIAQYGGVRPRVVTAPVADGLEDTRVVIINKKAAGKKTAKR
ncbi:16S rRNA methyltransferase [Bifidobacterium italicum]|uniref:Ribosomal RNA small subunit methyltransferase G n=1 Tax=Bifidobacterium italicum TaxID=1960968 RepID=A0A2A2EL60_9BIFI|nr:16S rRNA (guanine(527)-N(7))-methyltransferase RsmG [Bifidobacterium italicum]PAU69783.1 16S rRNA methyltransferase [Bifidobacterium italicum]